MIKSLYELGLVLKEEYNEYFNVWSNPFSNSMPGENKKVIVAKIYNGKLENKLEIEDFRENYLEKYLFRELAGSRATGIIPSLRYSVNESNREEEIRKHIERVQRSFEKNFKTFEKVITKKSNISLDKNNFINSELSKLNRLLSELELKKENRYLFIFKFDGKYPGEIPKLVELLESEAFDKYHKKSKSKNKVCSVTYNQTDTVWGSVDTLGFTVDDHAFMRGGFKPKDNYKMFPVSPKAVQILEGAKRLLFEKFTNDKYGFYNIRFVMVPHLINVKDDLKKEVYKSFVDRTDEKVDNNKNSLIANEKLIHEIIKDEKLSNNQIFYDILFYQRNQRQFLLKLILNDVLPSRFKELMKKKEIIENYYNSFNDKYYEVFVNLVWFSIFFRKKVQNQYIIENIFYQLLQGIFWNTKLDRLQLLHSMLNKIRTAFRDPKQYGISFRNLTLNSFILYNYLYELKIIGEEHKMIERSNENVSLNYSEFIKQHPGFFDSNYKKGIFLVGVLTSKLIRKQRIELNNEPFLRELKGLNLDKQEIKRIFTKLSNKMREWEIHKYNYELEQEAAEYLVEEHKITNHEISYIFTLGMVLGNKFEQEEIEKHKANKQNEEIENE